MRTTNVIVLASLNRGKIHEYQSLFKAFPELNLAQASDLVFNTSGLKNAETGNTYYDNAFKKAQLVQLAAKYPTISDDSGLEVDALEGRPGVFSDRYASQAKQNGQKEESNRDAANVQKLLQELKSVPQERRTARFVCTIVFFMEGLLLSATGKMEGSILEVPRGTEGFGYDPIFMVKDTDKSLAEMTLEEKNKVSHRAKALKSLMDQIKEKNIRLVRP